LIVSLGSTPQHQSSISDTDHLWHKTAHLLVAHPSICSIKSTDPTFAYREVCGQQGRPQMEDTKTCQPTMCDKSLVHADSHRR